MADGAEAAFKAAAAWVRTAPAPATPATDDQKLKLYGLYKQATEGDNTTGEPWKIQFEAHAKWSAWTAEKGKSKEQAMLDYVAELKKQRPDFTA